LKRPTFLADIVRLPSRPSTIVSANYFYVSGAVTTINTPHTSHVETTSIRVVEGKWAAWPRVQHRAFAATKHTKFQDYIEHLEFQPFRMFGIPIIPNFAAYRSANEIARPTLNIRNSNHFECSEFQSFRILLPIGVQTILFLEKYYNKRVLVLCHSVLINFRHSGILEF
jgi:hypothetical protein